MKDNNTNTSDDINTSSISIKDIKQSQDLDLKEVVIKRAEVHDETKDDDMITKMQELERLRKIQQLRQLMGLQSHNRITFKSVDDTEKPKGIIGLANIGNTCYMNSVLQCLFNIEIFKDHISDQNIIKDIYQSVIKNISEDNKKNYSLILSNIQLTTTFQLHKLMSAVWSDKSKHMRPINFKNVFASKIVSFKNFEQQDSQEALLCILDTIHVELQKPVNIDFKFCNEQYLELFNKADNDKISDIDCCEMESTYPDFWELLSVKRAIDVHNKKSYSLISKIFQSLVCSTLQCPECNYHTFNFDPSIILTVPIPNERTLNMTKINEQMKQLACLDVDRQEQIKQHLIMTQCNEQEFTLDECFKHLVNIEKLDDSNQWFCPQCEMKVNALKKSSIWIPSKIMIIHIKRFIQKQSVIVGHYSASKLNNKIIYPINGFNLNPYMSTYSKKMGNYQYDLIAVSNHIGGLNGGHYFSFVKSITDNKWYCLDDDKVSLMEESDVVSKDAYILFYKLKC